MSTLASSLIALVLGVISLCIVWLLSSADKRRRDAMTDEQKAQEQEDRFW